MIVAGLGLREAAKLASLEDALAQAGSARPDALACLAQKSHFPAIIALAAKLNLPLLALEECEIAGQPTLTCSPRIKARFATGSVAEALALSAAGRYGQARLIAPRATSADGLATAALARKDDL